MVKFANYYDILGVSRTASAEEIKKAFRKMAKESHPDLFQDRSQEEIEQRTKKFQTILNAYDILSNETKRQEYDREFAEYERRHSSRRSQARRQAGQRSSQYSHQQDTAHQSRTSYSTSGRTEQTRQEEQTRTTEGTDEASKGENIKAETRFQKAFGDVKQAWSEVRQEEQENSFLKRHKTLSGQIYKNFYKGNGSTLDEVVFTLKNGSLHILYETLYQLEKLTHITEDSIPKYVIRNRVLAYVLAFSLILSGAISAGKNDEYIVSQGGETFQTSQGTPPLDKIDGEDYIDEQEKQEEAALNQTYVAMRTYTIELGDTLSELAEDANTTVNAIMAENNLESPDVIKSGQTLYIPYVIKEEDLEYATAVVYYEPGTNIHEFAKEYSTDAATIVRLNQEAYEDGQIISGQVVIPTFASRQEINERKAEKAHTYNNQ